jgi:vacuolar protein sorting-associated protein 45
MAKMAEGVWSCLLAMNKKPSTRVQRNSDLGQRIAEEINVSRPFLSQSQPQPLSLPLQLHFLTSRQKRYLAVEATIQFRTPDVPPLLLILDRRDDPVTPLLIPWTYHLWLCLRLRPGSASGVALHVCVLLL